MRHLIAAVALTLAATPALADLMAPAAPTTIRGTITGVKGSAVSIRARDGKAVTVVLAPDGRVATVATVSLDAIKPNSFIGTTAEPGPNGTLRATEVHVFPEAMRGLGEGHYPWDTGKNNSMTNGSVSSMTNGNVSSMTNGSVGKVGSAKGVAGRTLTVDYKGGTQQVVVPFNVPIVMLAPGTPAALVPGAKLFTRAMKGSDGTLVTKQIAVGVNGTTPPM